MENQINKNIFKKMKYIFIFPILSYKLFFFFGSLNLILKSHLQNKESKAI